MGWPVAGSHSRTVPSSPALASSRPSGENATASTPPVWPRGWRRAGRWPGPTAAPCRRRRRWPAAARPGENATARPCRCGPARVAAGWPVAGSHSRTVPSSPALASSRPSGENATAVDPAGVAPRVAVGWPVAGSHSRTVPSSPALASSRPSGRERHRVDPAGVALEGGGGLAGGRVPQPHRAVVAGAGQQPPVGRERHRRSPRRCGLRGWRWAGRWPGPTAAPSRRRRRWPAAARRARTPRADPAGVAFEGGGGLAGGRVPQPHRPVVAGAGQQPPVRARTPPRRPRRCGPPGRGRGWAGRSAGPTAAPGNSGSRAASPPASTEAGASCTRLASVTARSPTVGCRVNRWPHCVNRRSSQPIPAWSGYRSAAWRRSDSAAYGPLRKQRIAM